MVNDDNHDQQWLMVNGYLCFFEDPSGWKPRFKITVDD